MDYTFLRGRAKTPTIYLIGGGAKLPGIAGLLGATKAKNPDTANIDGIALLADDILGGA